MGIITNPLNKVNHPQPFDALQAIDRLVRVCERERHRLPEASRGDFASLMKAALAQLKRDDAAAARHARKAVRG